MSDRLPGIEALRAAQQAARRIVVDGAPWLVYELPAMVFDRRHGPSLVFESNSAVRRVRDFPTNLRAFSDDDLFALSWST
jgi:hypothetical protein